MLVVDEDVNPKVIDRIRVLTAVLENNRNYA
jgi:hypothetical protein